MSNVQKLGVIAQTGGGHSLRLRTAMKVGGSTLIVAGIGLWIWGQFDRPHGESIAGSALTAVVIGVILLTHVRLRHIEEAYNFGYDLGYERGYKAGRDTQRPTVVSICDAPAESAERRARSRECRSTEGDHV